MRLSSRKGPEGSARPRRRIDRIARNREDDLGAHPRLAPHFDLATNLLRSLAHARQTKVPGSMRVKRSRADAMAIVPNAQLKLAGVVPDLHLNPTSTGVPERIA